MLTNDQAKAFLLDLIEVYKRHGLSLAHEDSHGAFLVERYSEINAEWLLEAFISKPDEHHTERVKELHEWLRKQNE